MSIVSHRIAMREGRLQARMKERAQKWWHMNHCPNCRAKLDALRAAVGEPGSMFELAPSIRPTQLN